MIKPEIQIHDGIFSSLVYEQIKKYIHENTSYFWVDDTSYSVHKNNLIVREKYNCGYALSKTIFYYDLNKKIIETNDQSFQKIEFLILNAISQHTKIDKFLRVRIGVIFKNNYNLLVHPPHVDTSIKHKNALFYFTTCDAPTIIYNELYDFNSGMLPIKYFEKHLNNNVTEMQKIECVDNRLTIFDGSYYHSSTIPTNVDRRIVMNINFTY